MTTKVIVTGKGGSGKSTIATLIARLAVEKSRHVIVVDADESNPGIQRMIGLSGSKTGLIDAIGGRERVFGSIKGASSEELQDLVSSVIEEAGGNDLHVIQVGKIRDAGSGCACPHGAITREILSYPFKSETFVVVDAEAGIEHFGRGIDAKADLIIFVVDPSYDSMVLCREAKQLADSIAVRFLVVLNKVDSEHTATFLKTQLKGMGVDAEAVIPYDVDVARSTMQGKPLEATSATESLYRLLDRILER